MKLKSLMLFLIISATYLIAGSDELPTVELKIYTDCSARKKNNDSLFEYEELRDNIGFKIIDPNNLKGITPFGENPNANSENLYYSTPQSRFDSTYYEDIKTSKKVDTSKKHPYSYIPKVNYFIENSKTTIQLIKTQEYNVGFNVGFNAQTDIIKNNINYISIDKNRGKEDMLGEIFFTTITYEDGIHLIEKIADGDNLKFVGKYNLFEGKVKTTKMKVYEKKFLAIEPFKLIDNKIVIVKPPVKTIDVDILEETSTPITKEYEIIYDKNLLQKVKAECEERIVLKKNELIRKDLAIVLGAILGLGVLLLVLRFIYEILKSKAIELKVKAVELQQRAHEYKVQKIAEDEAIRATVKKAIENDIDEAKELQELINKAVAKGDTETAQSLLAILERQKNKNGKE